MNENEVNKPLFRDKSGKFISKRKYEWLHNVCEGVKRRKTSHELGACEFPESWAGAWFQSGKRSNLEITATTFDEKTCFEKGIEDMNDTYVLYGNTNGIKCYVCLIINDRHKNVIQFREVGDCLSDYKTLKELCDTPRTDSSLITIFRLNAEPVACPFVGSFTFTYNQGDKECGTPVSHAESCTDSSKLLLKYQACPDIVDSESTIEELQCLAIWKDGRNKYVAGALNFVNRATTNNEDKFRCFLYEKPEPHHQDKEKISYVLAQSGDSSCSALTSVSEGSRTICLTKVDKDHSKCRYPAWVTEHHDWHSLGSSKTYHFMTGNATLKVSGSPDKHERIVCHNEVKTDNDYEPSKKVKLVAHITSGCDIGYVCMIFHRRDSNVIELQQSISKTIMPDEACQTKNESEMPYVTLTTSSPEKKKCPLPGRYKILEYIPKESTPLITAGSDRLRRSLKPIRAAEKMQWSGDNEDEVCQASEIQIGCGSADQSEIIVVNTCEQKQIVYSCQNSWEEDGIWYTIVSVKNNDMQSTAITNDQKYCFSMQWMDQPSKVSGIRGARQQEAELWLSGPARDFQWTYKLSNQGICEDLTRASATSSSSLLQASLLVSACAAICILLSR